MNSILLSEADFSRLHHIYHQESPPHLPAPAQRREIGLILASAEIPDDPATLRNHVGLDDEITLTSPADADDDFVLRIVAPGEADPANDRISLLAPVSLAVLGRAEGSLAEWEANGRLRRMRVTAIRKASGPPHPHPDPIMKRDPSTHVTLRLRDGKSTLAEWTHQFDHLPTIGERLHIEDVSGDLQPGFRDSATVTRIGIDARTGHVTLELDALATAPAGTRNVVFLNSNYIPDALHRIAEEFVRRHIDHPVFEWIRSQHPAPISGIHGPMTPSRPALGQLQAALRERIARASVPAAP